VLLSQFKGCDSVWQIMFRPIKVFEFLCLNWHVIILLKSEYVESFRAFNAVTNYKAATALNLGEFWTHYRHKRVLDFLKSFLLTLYITNNLIFRVFLYCLLCFLKLVLELGYDVVENVILVPFKVRLNRSSQFIAILYSVFQIFDFPFSYRNNLCFIRVIF
jgi:hypothetical protein